jgi:penicillin amidase
LSPERSSGRSLALPLAVLLVVGLAAGCSDDDGDGDGNGGADAAPQDVAQPDGGDTAVPDTAEDVAGDVAADTGPADAGDTGDGGSMSRQLDLPGLSAPVTVQLDGSGVLHIDCETNQDCYTAQGYFHADQRFFEMDLVRRQTRGELSQVIGMSFGLDSDKEFRRLLSTRQGEPLEEAYVEAMSDDTKAMFDAYARGVNAWLDDMRQGENGAELTEEYDFPIVADDNIRDWEPADTAALYLQLAELLSFSAGGDISRGEVLGKMGLSRDGNTLSSDVASDLFTVKPGVESNIMDAAGVSEPMNLGDRGSGFGPSDVDTIRERLAPAADALGEARRRLESVDSLVFGPETGKEGSNNWVLDGSRTANGRPLLANDPHLSLNNPAIWHYVELDSKTNGSGDLHVAGASIPSVPGIVVGQNEQLAWGVTTARLDLADAYVETLNNDGTAVIRDGQEIDLIEREYTFEGKNGNTETATFEYVPGHGPILSKDTDNNRAVSVKWVAQNPGNDLDFLPDLMTAQSVDEAMTAMEPVRTINQSWVFMDRDAGDEESEIAWYPRGAIPKRPWADSETPNWLPLPGDGSAEWQGHISPENQPQITDPPNGFVATANNDFDGSYTDGDATNDGHLPWQHPPATGHRHARIVEMIEEGGNEHTPETMHEMQADTYSIHGELLAPEIVSTARENSGELSDGAQQVVDALDDWNYTCPTGLDGLDPEEAAKASDSTAATEAIGCAAFHVMLPPLTDEAFDDELAELPNYGAASNWESLQRTLIYLFTDPSELERGEDYFDDVTTQDTTETRADVVLAALDRTNSALADAFGSETPDDWRWGRIHTVTFTSLFSQAGIDAFDYGPFTNDGGLYTVDVADPIGRDGDFSHPNGPSIRVVFEAREDRIQGYFQLPGGQDNHRESRFYQSLTEDYLTNTPRELLFERDAVDANAVETISVEPAE